MGAPANRAGLPVTPPLSQSPACDRAELRHRAMASRATSDGCWGAPCEGSVRRGAGPPDPTDLVPGSSRAAWPTRERVGKRHRRAVAAGNRASRDEPGQSNTPVCSFCTNYLLQRQHLRREDRGSDSNPVSLVQMRLVPALRPAQAPHFDASAGLLAALVAVPSTLDLRAPL